MKRDDDSVIPSFLVGLLGLFAAIDMAFDGVWLVVPVVAATAGTIFAIRWLLMG